MCLGDLNTMGLNVTYAPNDMTGQQELDRYTKRMGRQKMRLLTKNSDFTWWNGIGSSYPKSDLDHIFAAEHLKFRKFGGKEIDVRGWPKEQTDAETDRWINEHSDHAMLFAEVRT